MAIQWFPGHMYLTQKAISERIKEIDVVIELFDSMPCEIYRGQFVSAERLGMTRRSTAAD